MIDAVKILRDLLNDPSIRHACGIPNDAEIDEDALATFAKWCNAIIGPPDLPLSYGPFISPPITKN
jgi:hypothetical protein